MILNFDDDLGKRHFEFCFVGFVMGGSLQPQKGLTVLRRELGLFEKLESISDLKPCGKKMGNGEPERQLKVEGARQIQVDLMEFDLLYGYIAGVPWQSGTPTKHAVETIDWLLAQQRAST